jgi:S1-C subfamily serine protease
LGDLGADVFTIGFPNPDIQGQAPKLTDGVISSMKGMLDDIRTYQISVPLQAGNSGGVLADEAGNAVGIVVSKLNAATVFRYTGDIPENVNFAVKISYAMPIIQSVPDLADRLPKPNPVAAAGRDASVTKAVAAAVGMVLVRE